MLGSLITSKTRIKLLLKFFLNPSMKAYLRGLADEFGESTNAIRLELNHMEGVGLLKSESEGNKKVYHANTGHPLFYDIHNLVLKHSGITSIIDQVIEKTGDIEKVWIKGDFAQGKDSDVVELIVMGVDVNTVYLYSLVKKPKELIGRKVVYQIVSSEKYSGYISENEKTCLIWEK